MGFFGRLFRRPRPRPIIEPAPQAATMGTLYGGHETLEVVGESFYQDTIWAVVGGRRRGRITHDIQAVLVPEFDNAHDMNAVRIDVHGSCVGHLSRANAEVYRPGLIRLMERSVNGVVCLRGQVIGGHHEPTELYFLGVFLDHDPADFGIPPRVATTIGFRTGLSEAFAADALDDSYDLSWYHDIPDDDVRAVRYLRGQLAVDPDPIDRHFMMAELECRLYKSRDAFVSALDEYDQVCVQHDTEMATIAPALYARFGKLPLLDTYRQACIRQQKAKNWPAVKWWAERGLAVYGPHAGVEGVVEDLTKRLNQAIAKLEAGAQPKPVPNRSRPGHPQLPSGQRIPSGSWRSWCVRRAGAASNESAHGAESPTTAPRAEPLDRMSSALVTVAGRVSGRSDECAHSVGDALVGPDEVLVAECRPRRSVAHAAHQLSG